MLPIGDAHALAGRETPTNRDSVDVHPASARAAVGQQGFVFLQ